METCRIQDRGKTLVDVVSLLVEEQVHVYTPSSSGSREH